MNIYANRGSFVLVTKETAHNGYDHDKKDVEDNLQIGKLYTVHKTIVHSSSTEVYLMEFPDKKWNSVNFISYVPNPTEDEFREPIGSGDKLEFNAEAYEFAYRKWVRENKDQIEAREMYKNDITKLSQTEFLINSIQTFNREAIGCLRYKKHVMISFTKEGDKTIYDMFLDKETAESLYKRLGEVL